MTTTAAVAAAAVTMKTPTRLRRGRRAAGRLRCCDNAVLPSAKRQPGGTPGARTAAVQGSESHDGPAGIGFLREQGTAFSGPAPSRHNVARTDPADQAFPPKKLCWK